VCKNRETNISGWKNAKRVSFRPGKRKTGSRVAVLQKVNDPNGDRTRDLRLYYESPAAESRGRIEDRRRTTGP
jgi:hypothetical protein